MFKKRKAIRDIEKKVNSFKFLLDRKPVYLESCQGYKLAWLVDDQEPYFESLFSGFFSLDDVATCQRGHQAPVLECSCGFYSFKNFLKAKRENRFFKSAFVVKVENYGDVVEHREGWRAQGQVISEIIIPEKCGILFCNKRIQALGRVSHVLKGYCLTHHKNLLTLGKRSHLLAEWGELFGSLTLVPESKYLANTSGYWLE